MRALVVNILCSDDFDRQSHPLIVETFRARSHEVRLHKAGESPQYENLLDGDVYLDRSPVTDSAFFSGLAIAYFKRRAAKRPLPVMVDNPFATMASVDKRRTHALLPDLVPESYNLDGTNNREAIGRFAGDEYVIIKDPFGWYSQGVERMTPRETLAKYGTVSGLIVQKYLPYHLSVGRILTLNHDADFEVLCSYTEYPDIWRSGVGATSSYDVVEVDKGLYEFARRASKTSGLYLNGMDYTLYPGGRYVLYEINSVPNLFSPHHNLGVDTFTPFVRHIERSAARNRR